MTLTSLQVSVHELCQFEGLSQQMLIEVVEHGIAEPYSGNDFASWTFDTHNVHWVKKAVRLHYDLHLDWIAIAMVIDLLQQNEYLQKENQRLQERIKRFIQDN